MVWVPAGEFTMGDGATDPPRGPFDTGPNRLREQVVNLNGYWIYKTEVTVAQYRKFCEATGHPMPMRLKKPVTPPWGWIDKYPMTHVNWYDATAYAEWAGSKLPAEAQWEKAARGTDKRKYPWGMEFESDRLRCSVGAKMMSPVAVGSYPAGASPYGCLDMAGNVMEICRDIFLNKYKGGYMILLRGGAFTQDYPHYFTCFRRIEADDRTVMGTYLGFRCVQGD
jgi:iron(II)-dependent oxidoreductase